MEIHEVFFHMNDVKNYCGKNGDEEGKWVRLFHVPLAAIDTQIDPRNKEQFVRRASKYNTYGALQDKAKELSEIRAQKDGKDPIKEQYFSDYSKSRNGAKHPASMPKKFENDRISIDLS